jgi:hypothetical protein
MKLNGSVDRNTRFQRRLVPSLSLMAGRLRQARLAAIDDLIAQMDERGLIEDHSAASS